MKKTQSQGITGNIKGITLKRYLYEATLNPKLNQYGVGYPLVVVNTEESHPKPHHQTSST